MKPSFNTLVDTHGPEIFTYIWRLLWDTDDTEDCFQDTFLRAYEAYHRLRSPANYRAWLYKIATNTASTFLKKRSRLASRTSDLEADLIPENASFQDPIDIHFTHQEVRAAVERLPKKQRAALLLRNYQGLSYKEIGAALDTSSSAAHANVYQALKKLREQFAQTETTTEAS